MGADSNWPMAAATRSSVRVAAYPIGAVLSASLRELLLQAAGVALNSFFLLAGPRGLPCAACRRAPALLPLSRARSFLHPETPVLCSASRASELVPIAVSVSQRIPCCLSPVAASHTALR